MGWGYNSRVYNSARIPLITGFEFMRDHFKAVEPIRGRSTECKPLGTNRRFAWYEIKERTNCYMSEDEPLGRLEKSYACSLGNRDMVEFYRDGSIVVRDNYWHSPTSMGFLTHSLRHFGAIESFGGNWYFKNNKGMSYRLRDHEGIHLVKGDDGHYAPTNPIQEYTYSAKRKVLNKYRKHFKEFMDYTRTMLAMDERVTMDTREMFGFASGGMTGTGYYARNTNANRTKFFPLLDKAMSTGDLDLTYNLAQYCAHAFGGYDYRVKTHACSPTAFTKGFVETLKYQFADEVFESKPVDIGIGFKDANYKYVASK